MSGPISDVSLRFDWCLTVRSYDIPFCGDFALSLLVAGSVLVNNHSLKVGGYVESKARLHKPVGVTRLLPLYMYNYMYTDVWYRCIAHTCSVLYDILYSVTRSGVRFPDMCLSKCAVVIITSQICYVQACIIHTYIHYAYI